MKLLVLYLAFFTISSCVKPGAPIPEQVPESYVGESRTDFLIYDGPGSWNAEIRSFKTILFSHGATYETLFAEQINQLSLANFKKYKAILFVGGDAPTVRKSLTQPTRMRIRQAVQMQGLNYLGFCAGAWLAVAPAPSLNEDVIYGLGVVAGPVLERNFLAKAGSPHSLDEAIFPDGLKRKLLWYGGPVTPDQPDAVIAKYSDGTPAISQIWSGKGFVIISGLHPAATKSILKYLGHEDPQAIAPDFAWSLLQAVIYSKPLPSF